MKADGSLVCWGRANAPESTWRFSQVSLGTGDACGVLTSGAIAWWGANSSCPGVALSPPAGTFKAVVDGQCARLALKPDGTALCWGRCYGTVPSVTFTQLALGNAHACGIRADQTIVCWGDNSLGQLRAPVGTFTEIVAGALHTCALRTDGSVACWGMGEAYPYIP
jgi:hypothetical protein